MDWWMAPLTDWNAPSIAKNPHENPCKRAINRNERHQRRRWIITTDRPDPLRMWMDPSTAGLTPWAAPIIHGIIPRFISADPSPSPASPAPTGSESTFYGDSCWFFGLVLRRPSFNSAHPDGPSWRRFENGGAVYHQAASVAGLWAAQSRAAWWRTLRAILPRDAVGVAGGCRGAVVV